MSWDIDKRRRYTTRIAQEGKKKMYRARGMIVGCTGAGKTTLLKKLQRTDTTAKHQPTETTSGLEIHEHLFQILSDRLDGIPLFFCHFISINQVLNCFI